MAKHFNAYMYVCVCVYTFLIYNNFKCSEQIMIRDRNVKSKSYHFGVFITLQIIICIDKIWLDEHIICKLQILS